jgi:hypothetical protein
MKNRTEKVTPLPGLGASRFDAKKSRTLSPNAIQSKHTPDLLGDGFTQDHSTNQRTMKNFLAFPIKPLAFVAGCMIQMTCADAGVNFLGVSAGENGFVEYDAVANPEQALFSFQIRRGPTTASNDEDQN